MARLDSEEMRKLCRYSVDCDFRALGSSDPESGAALDTCCKPLGTETSFLNFAIPHSSLRHAAPTSCAPCIDDAETRIAFAHGPNIYIHDLSGFSPQPVILRGHAEDVRAVQFVPGSSTRLVSYTDGQAIGRVGRLLPPGGPEIILWDTEAQGTTQCATDEAIGTAADCAISRALGVLGIRSTSTSRMRGPVVAPPRAPLPDVPISVEHRFTLDPAIEAGLRETICTALRKAESTSLILGHTKLSGRLTTSFQSTVFNHSGTKLVYQPGERGMCNGDSPWDLCVRDITVPASEPPSQFPPMAITLVGHRDTIVWTGFSPDDSLLASVSWDKTIRVWDVDSGTMRWCWRTEGQNWTGEWSPDGGKFLGTCGNGTVYLWDVSTGEEIWRYHAQWQGWGHWCRCVAWCPPCPELGQEGGMENGLIAIGGDVVGRVLLLSPDPPGEGGKKEAIQERRLSTRDMDAPQTIRNLASGFLGIKSLRFLPAPEQAEGVWGVKLAMSLGAEDGVEVVDLVRGRKWRIGMRPEGGAENGDEPAVENGSYSDGPRDLHWKFLRRTGQIALVDITGVRFFDLD